MVWLGTMRPLPESLDASQVVTVAAEAPVRARLTSPFVTLARSFKGCGCGFHSSGPGVETTDEARSLLDAVTPAERDNFLEEQRSREWLRGLVESATAWGRVELFACWAGDEGKPAIDERPLVPELITARTEPFLERTRYVTKADPNK